MKLTALTGAIQKTYIEVPGVDGEPAETVEVHYHPGALTLGVSDQIAAISAGPGASADSDATLFLLASIIAWWDLEEDVEDEFGNIIGTKHLGTTAPDIKKVPLSFIGKVLDRLNQEARPSPLTDGPSGDGSPLEGSLVGHQNGTLSSESPDTTDVHHGSSSLSP